MFSQVTNRLSTLLGLETNTMLDLATRRKACEDTISRSPAIANETPGASLESSFIPAQLPELSKSSPDIPNLQSKPVQIIDSDSFAAARNLLHSNPSQHGKVAVLNLASDAMLAGGWRHTLSFTQEEALCYSSTLYSTFDIKWYPWPNLGPGSTAGIYSPEIVVFKDTLDNKLVDLPVDQRFVVSVLTVAAPRLPELTGDRLSFAKKSDLKDLREKIKLVLRMAAHNGKTSLILAAMGCGAYRCPPELVAREMRAILLSEEFEGWFENVTFAIYARGPVGQQNLDVFRREFGLA